MKTLNSAMCLWEKNWNFLRLSLQRCFSGMAAVLGCVWDIPCYSLGWLREQDLESLGGISKDENCRMLMLSDFSGVPPSCQDSAGVPIPGGVENVWMWPWRMWFSGDHGAAAGWWLHLGISKVFAALTIL